MVIRSATIVAIWRVDAEELDASGKLICNAMRYDAVGFRDFGGDS